MQNPVIETADLEVAEEGVLGVLVNVRLVADVLGAAGVAQRRQRLLVVVRRRTHVGHHHRPRVAAQRVCKNPPQLGKTRLNTDQPSSTTSDYVKTSKNGWLPVKPRYLWVKPMYS